MSLKVYADTLIVYVWQTHCMYNKQTNNHVSLIISEKQPSQATQMCHRLTAIW